MKKTSHDIGATAATPGLDPCYVGWFEHFNACEYYQAHDILEVLWLRTTGPDRDFFKGLIQLAGAFVHLRKQSERPWHPKDGTRLRPATRLFLRGRDHLAPYGPSHLCLDVDEVCALCERLAGHIVQSDYSDNPWNASMPPRLGLNT